MATGEDQSLKTRTARTLKWNVIDRVAAQVLYAVTGIILANLLSPQDFGLVGAVLVFQAFASLLVDSGFSSALIQRKEPTRADYSTVLWFNLSIATAIYIILYYCAPLIADCFQGDRRIIPLSRVMFLTFILNALSIVQVNRLTKRMDMKPVAVADTVGLAAGAAAGIWLALDGQGAWAIVWQSIANAAVKAIVLWSTQRWLPLPVFSWKILRSYFSIGSRMMFTSFLNTVFLNLYSFFIGNRVGMVSLGYYTQSDKWSKMGIMSVYQVLTSSFLPALSAVQDDPERFNRVSAKMNRFTSYIIFPAVCFLVALASPLFHLLFDTKWDPSVILFQLLLVRGIFTVFIGYYNNVLLALGHARTIMWMEILRDGVAIAALVATLPYLAVSLPEDPVYGLTVMLWGQLGASALTCAVTLRIVSRLTSRPVRQYLADMAPYVALSLVIAFVMWFTGTFIISPSLSCAVLSAEAVILYAGINYLSGSRIQRDVFAFICGSKKADIG